MTGRRWWLKITASATAGVATATVLDRILSAHPQSWTEDVLIGAIFVAFTIGLAAVSRYGGTDKPQKPPAPPPPPRPRERAR